MKKKSKIKKGKLVLLGLAGAALITSLVYDNLKNKPNDELANEEDADENNSFEEVVREDE